MNLVIITGLSGAGKTTAMHFFEDHNFYCIDNLPVGLICDMVDLFKHQGEIKKIALVIDIREKAFLDGLFKTLQIVRDEKEVEYKIVFLEADEATLSHRYLLTRRPHPFSQTTIEEGVKKEKEYLCNLRERADLIVDTSNFTPQSLYQHLREVFQKLITTKVLNILLITFGYKFGIPKDVDLVFDLRFLPNPYYHAELINLAGDDPKIIEFLRSHAVTIEFLNKLYSLLDFLIPQYIDESRTYLRIAFGCTGGQHRSMAIAECVRSYLQDKNPAVKIFINHRDYRR